MLVGVVWDFWPPGGDSGTVRDTLQAILNRQRPTGEMPRRQGNHKNATAMIGDFLKLPLQNMKELDQVEFRNERDAFQYDGNALPLIAAAEYATRTGDVTFLKENYLELTRGADWLQRQDEQFLKPPERRLDLIDQDPSSDWKDVVGREGVVAYTNAVTYQAHLSMATIDRLLGHPETAEKREAFAATLKDDFNQRLWDEKAGYYPGLRVGCALQPGWEHPGRDLRPGGRLQGRPGPGVPGSGGGFWSPALPGRGRELPQEFRAGLVAGRGAATLSRCLRVALAGSRLRRGGRAPGAHRHGS